MDSEHRQINLNILGDSDESELDDSLNDNSFLYFMAILAIIFVFIGYNKREYISKLVLIYIVIVLVGYLVLNLSKNTFGNVNEILSKFGNVQSNFGNVQNKMIRIINNTGVELEYTVDNKKIFTYGNSTTHIPGKTIAQYFKELKNGTKWKFIRDSSTFGIVLLKIENSKINPGVKDVHFAFTSERCTECQKGFDKPSNVFIYNNSNKYISIHYTDSTKEYTIRPKSHKTFSTTNLVLDFLSTDNGNILHRDNFPGLLIVSADKNNNIIHYKKFTRKKYNGELFNSPLKNI